MPDLTRIGFPIAEVTEDGKIFITKVEGSGGIVTVDTCTEQMLYEVQDPCSYLTSDVTADFSGVSFIQAGIDRVEALGASGGPRPDKFKVSIGYKDCYIGEGEISYGGTNCHARALLARDILQERITNIRKLPVDELKIDLIGVNALYRYTEKELPVSLNEIRVRAAARTKDPETAAQIGEEVESLYTNGPAGGGGAVKKVTEVLSVASMLIKREDAVPEIMILEVSE